MAEIIRGIFTDFDELAATAKGWDLDLAKLDGGTFDGEIFQWITEGFILSRGRFRSHLRQEGSPPPGLRTLTVHISRDMSQYWRGRQVTGDQLLVFPAGSEVDTVSDPRFDIFTLSFDEEALLAQADGMGCRVAGASLKHNEVLQCAPHDMGRIRRLLFDMTRLSETAEVPDRDIKRTIQTEIIRLLEGTSGFRGDRPRARKRLRIVRKAQDHLRDHASEAVTVGDLSRAVGVSIRTLQYAFREHFGIGPKGYINALRLNRVRKSLKGSGAGGLCVSDAANQQGFWHMGQFAADYRRLFDETPSDTLIRAHGK